MRDPEPLQERDFASAGALLAEAFHDNPAHVYVFPDAAQRARRLGWLLQRNLEIQAPLEHGFSLVDGSEGDGARRVVAMGFWTAPGRRSVSPRSLRRPALLEVPLRCGLGAVWRLLEVAGVIEEQRRRAVGDAPVWFLNNMAVAQELRGTGTGTALLDHELATRIDPSGAAAVLATQRPANVAFYRRLGFEVASFLEAAGSRSPKFPNWTMVRPPAGSA